MAKLTILGAIDYLETLLDIDGCVINETWPEETGWVYCPDCRTPTVWGERRAPHTMVGECPQCGQWWNLIRLVLGLKPTKEQAESFMIAVKLLDSELKEGE